MSKGGFKGGGGFKSSGFKSSGFKSSGFKSSYKPSYKPHKPSWGGKPGGAGMSWGSPGFGHRRHWHIGPRRPGCSVMGCGCATLMMLAAGFAFLVVFALLAAH